MKKSIGNGTAFWIAGASIFCLSILVLVLVFQDTSDPPKTSESVDVVLTDSQGYQHFLVFEKRRARFEAWSEIALDLWVDDWVAIDPVEVEGLKLSGTGYDFFLPLKSFRKKPSPVNDKETLILRFELNGQQFRSVKQVPAGLHLSMKTGAGIEFKPTQSDRWIEAIRAVE